MTFGLYLFRFCLVNLLSILPNDIIWRLVWTEITAYTDKIHVLGDFLLLWFFFAFHLFQGRYIEYFLFGEITSENIHVNFFFILISLLMIEAGRIKVTIFILLF